MPGPDRKPAADARPAARPGAQVERAVQRGHAVGHVLDAGPAARPGHVDPLAVVNGGETEFAGDSSTLITIVVARACLIAFCRASRQQKYTAASISGG